jgi:hypothetical protein
MAQAFHAVALSLVYLLWNACRKVRRNSAPPPEAAPPEPDGDERVEQRLDCLSVLARPLPPRRS